MPTLLAANAPANPAPPRPPRGARPACTAGVGPFARLSGLPARVAGFAAARRPATVAASVAAGVPAPLRVTAGIAALALALVLAALTAGPARAQQAAAPAPAMAASAPAGVAGAVPAPAPAPGGLDQRVQDLKADVVRLNRDLLVLEEELLYPAGTQVALFVSMDVGKLFELESVSIRLDDKLVVAHLYTPLQVQALHRGGMQRIWVGNLRTGEHRLDAFFTGRGPHERDYKRGATLKFDKGTDPKVIELRVKDSLARLQPEFEIKVWQ